VSSSSGCPPALVCFDLDGTLIRGTTVSLILAERLGHLGQMQQLEADLAAGRIPPGRIAEATAPAMEGLRLADLPGLLGRAPMLRNLEAGVERLRAGGCRLTLATTTWKFAADYFASRLGMEAGCGTEIRIEDGIARGQLVRFCRPEDKGAFLAACRARWSIPRERTVAVGDSGGDLPLFREAGLRIALNAIPALRAEADVALETEDFAELATAILGWLGTASGKGPA
jgi:phosphoserine phosphatase